MKPRTIADALIAKHGVNAAHKRIRERTSHHLYGIPRKGRPLDSSSVHRAIFWIVVGQMVEKVGNGRNWT